MRVIGTALSRARSQPGSPKPVAKAAAQPTFRSGVELVTIDVVATDRSGKPVHDLKATDFELFEDGKSQPIKTFQFIDASMVPTEAILPPGVVSNDVEPGGIFALVLDEIGYYVDRSPGRAPRRRAVPEGRAAAARSRGGRSLGRRFGFHADVGSHARARGDSGRRPAAAIAAFVSNRPAATPSRRRRRLRYAPSPGSLGTRQLRGARSRGRKAAADSGAPQGDHLVQPRRRAARELGKSTSRSASPLGRNDDALREIDRSRRAPPTSRSTPSIRAALSRRAPTGRDNPGAVATSTRSARIAISRPRPAAAPSSTPTTSTAALRKVAVENRAYYLLGYEPAQATDRRSRRRARFASSRKAPGVELLHRSLYLPGIGDGQRFRS